MKAFFNYTRSLIFSIVLVSIVSVSFTVPVVSESSANVIVKTGSINIENYIVYVWKNGVRWAVVYDQDGIVIDEYPDPEE